MVRCNLIGWHDSCSYNQKLQELGNSYIFSPFLNTTEIIDMYRPCACVGMVRILYWKVYDFPHTPRHFVGQWNSSNVHVDPLLAPYQHYTDSWIA